MFRESAPELKAAEILIYRNGFVFSTAQILGYPFESWTVYQIGQFVLQVHPDASCVVQVDRGLTSALLGEVFDPEQSIYDQASILKDLVRAATKQDFDLILDRLGGRFVLLLARSENEYEVFQDAMGSRTVFYAAAHPVVASHSEIVAKAVGSGFNDFFVPFLTSRNYINKDTKYLPGIATPYEKVFQLTPNTKLSLPNQTVARFWPREGIEKPTREEEALEFLIAHISGVLSYFQAKRFKPVIGLTAGTDSRLILAAFRSSSPYLFTYIRSESGTDLVDTDTRQAELLAEKYGLTRDVYPVTTKPKLSDANDMFSYAYRRSTGYLRGSTSLWPKALAERNFDYSSTRFIRGFGGEVLRGYYQGMKNKIQSINERQLANAYDINAGSSTTRELFVQFMDVTGFNDASLHGRDPNDIFYWEHRMGIWGSTAMSEVDLSVSSLAGYNSRNLFNKFLALPWESRKSRAAFHQATQRLAPLLLESTLQSQDASSLTTDLTP